MLDQTERDEMKYHNKYYHRYATRSLQAVFYALAPIPYLVMLVGLAAGAAIFSELMVTLSNEFEDMKMDAVVTPALGISILDGD